MELSLGEEYFITNNKDNRVQLISSPEKQIEIKAGQFALLITEEFVTLPGDKIAFISIKAGVKFRGLINVSGFHVDPGFTGRLKFSVYNAGPRSIILEKGKPYFPIWFSNLISPLAENELYSGDHQKQSSITEDDIMRIQGDLASPSDILEKLKALTKETEDKIKYLDTDLSNKIRDLERKVFNVDWLKRIIIGVLFTGILGLLIRYCTSEQFSREDVYNMQQKENIQQLINQKIDSAFKQNDAIKKISKDSIQIISKKKLN
jgi:dCTP deaminase